MTYRLFSVDDHIIEPADVWTSRLPAKYADICPRVIEQNDRELWVYEDQMTATMGLNAVAGKPPEEWGFEPARFADMIPACYDPHARAEAFGDNGIVGSVSFPTLPGFGGRLFNGFKDKALADLCVKAYNDFVLDEWCAAAPDLYVPTVMAQLWDPVLAAAEVRRTATRGARALTWPENTWPLDLPPTSNEHWDPLYDAMQETGIVFAMHLGASGRMPAAHPEALTTAIITSPGGIGMETICDLMFSRIVREFPDLKFVITEGGIGYLPYLLERADDQWERHRFWAGYDDLRPSEVFARNIWVCAVGERFGLENRDRIGVDKILWECDFPHSETPWPHSQEAAGKQLAGLPDDDVARITHRNAQELYRFDGAASPAA